jgi:pSer/pThr/pTyr-binding forkhead associated (FHA) protein
VVPPAGTGALLIGRDEPDDDLKMERIEKQLRKVTAELWLDNLFVSRHHAEIFLQADQVCVCVCVWLCVCRGYA